MPRSLPHLVLAALLGLAALPVAAAPLADPSPGARAASAPGAASVLLAQYYAPPPPRPRYRPPPRRHCWTQTQRVVQYDRWGRPHVRFVPRTVCGYRR